jgi:S-DNA-T family DNA segregation ATPase FtsK/SpoIIIE
MVLGDGAREAGADCHKIPESSPGVAYVKLDGVREPVRVRASYLTDDDIADVARKYPTPVHLVPAPAPVPADEPTAEPVELDKPRRRSPRRMADGGAAA